MSWFSIPKTFVQETKAKAAEINENFQGIREALLYLLDEEERSRFLQLAGEAAKRKIAFGQAKCDFFASNTSDLVSVKHGLGVEPKSVVLTSSGFELTNITPMVLETNATEFKFELLAATSITHLNFSVQWVAIG